jgi:23S rRNA G2445 N2-methylase RlmL
MKYVAATIRGAEDLASSEIKSLLKSAATKIGEGRLLFSARSIAKFSPRLVNRIYSYMDHFSFSTKEDIVQRCSRIKFSFRGSFVVRCFREGSHDFDSRIIEREVGEVIYKQKHKVNLKNPDNIVVVDISHNNCFLGILLKDNVCKRQYRIRVFSSSINACLSAAAIKFSGVKKSDSLLDPFCRDGVIPIEACLLGCKKVSACDESMNNIKNAKINAGLAGAKVKFVRCNVDSLDLKIDEDSIDKIVSCPPFLSKKKKQSAIESLYKEFFYQLNAILKKAATVTLISPRPALIEVFAKRAGYKLLKEKKVFVSNMDYKIMVFKR